MLLKQGGDYGWPECYYDTCREAGTRARIRRRRWPEDRRLRQQNCPGGSFSGALGTQSAVFYDQKQFPAHYRNGVFIAFHGSWDRAPFAQGGYNVVFQPLAGAKASGPCEVFADGFAGSVETPEKAAHRPSGLLSDRTVRCTSPPILTGRIYRVVYVGGGAGRGSKTTPCPGASASPGPIDTANANRRRHHPDAGSRSPRCNVRDGGAG